MYVLSLCNCASGVNVSRNVDVNVVGANNRRVSNECLEQSLPVKRMGGLQKDLLSRRPDNKTLNKQSNKVNVKDICEQSSRNEIKKTSPTIYVNAENIKVNSPNNRFVGGSRNVGRVNVEIESSSATLYQKMQTCNPSTSVILDYNSDDSWDSDTVSNSPNGSSHPVQSIEKSKNLSNLRVHLKNNIQDVFQLLNNKNQACNNKNVELVEKEKPSIVKSELVSTTNLQVQSLIVNKPNELKQSK